MERPPMLVTPGDWRYIDTYFQSPGVTSIVDVFIVPAMNWNPEFGRVRGDPCTFTEKKLLGLSNDTKIVSIGWKVWSQITSTLDGRMERHIWYLARYEMYEGVYTTRSYPPLCKTHSSIHSHRICHSIQHLSVRIRTHVNRYFGNEPMKPINQILCRPIFTGWYT